MGKGVKVKVVLEDVDEETCEELGGKWRGGACELDMSLSEIKVRFGKAYFILRKEKR